MTRRRFAYPPQLLLLDGGLGQLRVGMRVLDRLGLTDKVPVASLAKSFEEVYLPGREAPLRLPRQSDALYLLQQLRDEAHRFAISYHRTLRGKRMTASALDGISGLGPRRRTRLLEEFGGPGELRKATRSTSCWPSPGCPTTSPSWCTSGCTRPRPGAPATPRVRKLCGERVPGRDGDVRGRPFDGGGHPRGPRLVRHRQHAVLAHLEGGRARRRGRRGDRSGSPSSSGAAGASSPSEVVPAIDALRAGPPGPGRLPRRPRRRARAGASRGPGGATRCRPAAWPRPSPTSARLLAELRDRGRRGRRHGRAQRQPAAGPADRAVRADEPGEGHADVGRVLRLQARPPPRRRPGLRLPLPAQSALGRGAAARCRASTQAVRDFVLGQEETGRLPRPRRRPARSCCCRPMPREGKSYLTIAMGCTGGRHRSVAIAEELGPAAGHQGRGRHRVSTGTSTGDEPDRGAGRGPPSAPGGGRRGRPRAGGHPPGRPPLRRGDHGRRVGGRRRRSSGRLRRQLGIIPPGDLRKCLVALAERGLPPGTAFEHRFQSEELAGHALGNLVIAGLIGVTGDSDRRPGRGVPAARRRGPGAAGHDRAGRAEGGVRRGTDGRTGGRHGNRPHPHDVARAADPVTPAPSSRRWPPPTRS